MAARSHRLFLAGGDGRHVRRIRRLCGLLVEGWMMTLIRCCMETSKVAFIRRGIRLFVPLSVIAGSLSLYLERSTQQTLSLTATAILMAGGLAIGALGGTIYGLIMWTMFGKPHDHDRGGH